MLAHLQFAVDHGASLGSRAPHDDTPAVEIGSVHGAKWAAARAAYSGGTECSSAATNKSAGMTPPNTRSASGTNASITA